MAITFTNPVGTTITTHAMNETLGAQLPPNGNNTVVVSDTIANAGNGQIGDGSNGIGDSYVGRLVIIDLGLVTEQRRLCTAELAGTGATYILTVHEDWDTNPVATTDTIHVPYEAADVEDGGVSNGVTFNTRTGLFEFTNFLTIANTGGFQVLNGTTIELDDRGVLTNFIIQSGGYLYSGYEASGAFVNGGVFVMYNNTTGEPGVQFQSGALGYVYDAFWWSQLIAMQFEHANGAGVQFFGTKLLNQTDETILFDMSLTDCSIAGKSAITEIVRVDAGTVIDGLVLSNTAGLNTTGTAIETLTLERVIFSGNLTNITVDSNKTWNIINPTWSIDITTQNEILFVNPVGSPITDSVNEKYSLDAIVQTQTGDLLSGALVILYEGLQTDDLVLVLEADGLGAVSDSWIYITYTDAGGSPPTLNTLTFGDHALRVFDYTYEPFIAAQQSNQPVDSTVTLITDSAISEQDQATAITNGSGVTPIRHASGETDPRPMKVLNYDAGTGSAATVGETITQAGSPAATGVVVEVLGNATLGTLVLENWNDVEFTDNQLITGGTSSFSATTNLLLGTAGFYEEYTWEIDSNDKTLQIVYDYLAAKMANLAGSPPALDVIFEQAHEWGSDQESQLLYSTGDEFFTERALQFPNIPGTSFDTSSEDTGPTGVAFTPDGTRMYIVGRDTDFVYQYELSTPWDVSTASVGSPGISFAVGSEDALPRDLAFKTDGTRMYIFGTSTDTVYQYDLSTAWDISTADGGSPIVSFVIPVSDDSNPFALAFKSDGTRMYIVGDGTDSILQYELSTAWDVSTAFGGSPIVSFFVGSEDNAPRGVTFKSDGTRMYVVGTGTDTVYQYDLSTAWDVSTAAFGSPEITFFVGSEDEDPLDVAFSSDGTRMYIVGNSITTSAVYQYDLSTAWDISTAEFDAQPFGEGVWLSNRGAGTTSYLTSDDNVQFTQNVVTVRVQGVTEGTAVKVIADETVGSITTGDVIFEKLADANGVAEITDFNYESAFDPSGVDVIVRARSSGLPTAAIQDDNGVFTDETEDANTVIGSPIPLIHLLPTVPVVNQDRYLFGHAELFNQLKLVINTAGTGGFTITWQYWNGAWTNLSGVVDGTSSFSISGKNIVSWTEPTDAVKTTINGQGPYYYVRAAYTAGTVTIVPDAFKCTLDVTKYLPFVQDNIITSSGLTVTASWNEDTIATF